MKLESFVVNHHLILIFDGFTMSFEYELADIDKMDSIPTISAIVSDQEPFHGSLSTCDVSVRINFVVMFLFLCFVLF